MKILVYRRDRVRLTNIRTIIFSIYADHKKFWLRYVLDKHYRFHYKYLSTSVVNMKFPKYYVTLSNLWKQGDVLENFSRMIIIIEYLDDLRWEFIYALLEAIKRSLQKVNAIGL